MRATSGQIGMFPQDAVVRHPFALRVPLDRHPRFQAQQPRWSAGVTRFSCTRSASLMSTGIARSLLAGPELYHQGV